MKLLQILALVTAGTGLLSAPAYAKDHDDHDWDKKHKKHSQSYYHGSRPNVTIGIVAPHRPYYGRSSTVIVERQRPVYYERNSYSSSRTYSSRTVEIDVQRGLTRRGYYRGPIDGDIGPGSRASIRAFQADNGLALTGRIDHALIVSLR